MEKPDERSRGWGQRAIPDAAIHVVDQLLAYRAVHEHPAGHLPYAFVVGLARLFRKPNVVNRIRGAALAAAAAGELRALPHRPAFVIQLPRRHRPATVDLADDGVVTDVHPVQELLAELGGTAQHSDAPQRDSRMVDGHQEHRQAFVLGHLPVGAGQAQPVVGGERAGAPGLGAVDHPTVAPAFGAGEDSGQVRPAAGFTQQLHQYLVAAQGGGEVPRLLLLGAGVEQRGAADGERGGVEDQRHLVAEGFGVECLLILVIQTQTAVLAGEADAGESACVEPPLQFSGPVPGPLVVARGGRRELGVDGGHVVGQPRSGAGDELRDGFGHLAQRPAFSDS